MGSILGTSTREALLNTQIDQIRNYFLLRLRWLLKQTWLGKSNVFNFHYYSFTLLCEWIFLRQRLKVMREKKTCWTVMGKAISHSEEERWVRQKSLKFQLNTHTHKVINHKIWNMNTRDFYHITSLNISNLLNCPHF